MKIVVKIGGAALEDKTHACTSALTRWLSWREDGHKVAVVHGGGQRAHSHAEASGQRRAISSTGCASPTLRRATSR